jgi:hypothetical protein
MEIGANIKISKEELTNLIKEIYQIDGDINFIIKEETYRCGYNDEGNVYSTRHIFDGIKIINAK